MMRAVLVVMLVTACQVASEQVECGGGTVCPDNYECKSFGCASREQIEACVGASDGAECSTSVGNGACVEAACNISVCGDREIEGLEVCDDGNTTNGDGCSGTCLSDETCGNGIFELDEACDCGDAEHPGGPRCRDANDVLTINGGSLCSATCTARLCGDGVLDPGEACDDGNNVAADDCSFDCRSLEVCGNGILDYFDGERCDDGNRSDHDGCSAVCIDETLVWSEVLEQAKPSERFQVQMAYDSARKRWVLFGGQPQIGNSIAGSDETWELDGAVWERRTFEVNPAGREGAAMAYDAKRGRIVMFGGVVQNSISTSSASLGDTWEYDGVAWRLVVTPTSPPPRMYGAMAYDGARGTLVLFGGLRFVNGTAFLGDVWEFDGATWTEVTIPGIKPAARYRHAMAYDALDGRLVVYGGISQGDVSRNDTWALSGTTWTDLGTSATVGVRYEHSMTYDTVAQKVVLYGGTNGSAYYSDVQELTNSTWASRTTTSAPPGRAGAAMAADPVTGRIVVAYGYNSTSAELADTNFLVGGTWTVMPLPLRPPQGEAATTYDTKRGRVVMYLLPNGSSTPETWVFERRTWRKLTTATVPDDVYGTALAYDAARDRVVLFGGDIETLTWELDGQNWVEVFPTNPPSARRYHAMAYDPNRQRVVLFGGYVGNGPVAQTWEYDGSAWTQITTATVPIGRSRHAMTYDLARQRIVMVGGELLTTNGPSNETWEYDGTDWAQRTLVEDVPARSSLSLAYDVAQTKVVAFGGKTPFQQDTNDAWILDDTTWTRLPTSPAPPRRVLSPMVYDTANHQLVLFGGFAGSTTFDDTWVLAIPATSTEEACTSAIDYDDDGTAGCADPECFGHCSALCPSLVPSSSCPTMYSHCGDGTCDPTETCRSCADCTIGDTGCPIRCGDSYCDSTENVTSCPGDCTP